MKTNETTLSTLPYKGTKDVYPKDMLIRNYLFDIWSRTAKQFGYEEYDTPMIEYAQLYQVKSGEEIANSQLYRFTDKGGRDIALLPEMTPSLARMIARKQNELSFPLRWFNIGKYFRYEKPQRGRNREFFQLNIDIIGEKSVTAEIEIIQFIQTVMNKLDAPKDSYDIKINSRGLLNYLFDEILKVEPSVKKDIAKAIDNYLKINNDEEFRDYLKEVGLDNNQTEKVMDYLKWEIADIQNLPISNNKGVTDLISFFNLAKDLSLTNITFAPYIVRGFDYYTGIVFEMYDVASGKNPRALFGGGRYDNLLEIFGKEKIPAVGLGWGDETTLNYLETYDLLPKVTKEIDVFVTLMDPSLFKETNNISNTFRQAGFNTVMQLSPIKLSKQLKLANAQSIPWVVIIGNDEIATNSIMLKNMNSKEQYNLPLDEAIKKISSTM